MASRAFTFSLQKVLEYREATERRLQTELAGLERERVAAEEARDALVQRRQDSFARLRRLHANEFDPVESALVRVFIEDLDRQIARESDGITLLQRRIAAKREELVQAARDRRVMERLREQAHLAYIAEHLRVEQNALDEIGGQSYVRERLISREGG